jgi:hypothetical protein
MVVVQPVRDWTCAECGDTDDLLQMHDAGPLCMACSDLDHLVFLPSGDAALTRRATKASNLSAVVVRWSRNKPFPRLPTWPRHRDRGAYRPAR